MPGAGNVPTVLTRIRAGRSAPAPVRPSGGRFMTSPSMRTDKAVSWYSLTRPTIWISGCTTRPEIIWKPISAPTVSVWSKTCCALSTMITTGSSLPIRSVMAAPVMPMWPTRKCMLMDCAERWSHWRRCAGSMASALMVRMPWMVSTSMAWRSASARYRSPSRRW